MRVRSEHWQVILDFAENNRGLITGKFSCSQGKTQANELWLTLANRLNSIGFGEKSVESWRKALVDWKSKTKAKAAAIKREAEKTGGGPTILLPLTDLESRLLALMGTTAVEGDKVPELGFCDKDAKETVLKVQLITPQTSTNGEPLKLFPSTPKRKLNECARRTLHGIETDHDYVETVGSKQKRIRPAQVQRISKELLEVNQESLNILRNLNQNMEVIADSMKKIANVLEKFPSVFP